MTLFFVPCTILILVFFFFKNANYSYCYQKSLIVARLSCRISLQSLCHSSLERSSTFQTRRPPSWTASGMFSRTRNSWSFLRRRTLACFIASPHRTDCRLGACAPVQVLHVKTADTHDQHYCNNAGIIKRSKSLF